MVKFERDNEKEIVKRAIEVLNHQKSLCSGKYNTDEVLEALKSIFGTKCYLCEYKDVRDYNVEHLKPHRKDKDLKFDWDNLFL